MPRHMSETGNLHPEIISIQFQSNKEVLVALFVAPRTQGWLPHRKDFEPQVVHILGVYK